MRHLKLPVVLLACVVVLVACGAKKKQLTAPTTTTTTAPPPIAPLTGLPLADAAIRARPLLVVKIDNAPEARPQFGIDKADDIVEERVEGGVTRFMALFHSQDSDQVGPVRSLRSTDPQWLRPEQGSMIAYSGGIDPVKALLPQNGITDLGADNHGTTYYKRRADRQGEHSMYTITSALRTLTPKGAPAPQPLFQYLPAGQQFGGSGAVALGGVSIHVSGGPSVFDWTWDPPAGVFRRGTDGKPHEIENIGQIGMTNVIVQFTPYRVTPWRDRANSQVDEAVVVGDGDAWVLSNGQIVKGHWSRPTADAITSYTDATGAPIRLRPGQTWLSLVPPDSPSEIH